MSGRQDQYGWHWSYMYRTVGLSEGHTAPSSKTLKFGRFGISPVLGHFCPFPRFFGRKGARAGFLAGFVGALCNQGGAGRCLGLQGRAPGALRVAQWPMGTINRVSSANGLYRYRQMECM